MTARQHLRTLADLTRLAARHKGNRAAIVQALDDDREHALLRARFGSDADGKTLDELRAMDAQWRLDVALARRDRKARP